MIPARFETAIPAIEPPQTYVLNCVSCGLIRGVSEERALVDYVLKS